MSKRLLRVFTCEFKHRMVLRLANGERVAALAEEAGVKPQLLYDWRAAYRAFGVAGLSRKRGRKPGWRRNQASAGLASSDAASSSDAAASSAKPADELAQAQARIAELERLVGRQQVDLHFFREALRLWDATCHDSGASTSTRSSRK
jgi:transposase